MDKVRCAVCGEEKDLLAMEPSYDRPDAYCEVPEAQRDYLTSFSDDDGRIRNADESECRHFLRVLLLVPIRGETGDCAWGLWVEVSASDWERAYDLWDDPNQGKEPPFPGRLANALKGYEGTVGLPGRVRLTAPKESPLFELDAGLDHPLAREQREGVCAERVVEWVSAHHH
ncbi:MAG: DUF2199 domain-containing protein [Gemmatimonadaceae bacterium]